MNTSKGEFGTLWVFRLAFGAINVLMLGLYKPETGIAPLRLMFLDPAQFEQAAEPQNTPASRVPETFFFKVILRSSLAQGG